MLSAADPRVAPLLIDSFKPGRVYGLALVRSAGSTDSAERKLDLSRAHPDVRAHLASAMSSENTASTSALLGSFNTLLAITEAVRNRSYVIAAAVTSESSKLSSSIAFTRASKSEFVVMGALAVLEITFDHIEGDAA